jgi:hypothetical protein
MDGHEPHTAALVKANGVEVVVRRDEPDRERGS